MKTTWTQMQKHCLKIHYKCGKKERQRYLLQKAQERFNEDDIKHFRFSPKLMEMYYSDCG